LLLLSILFINLLIGELNPNSPDNYSTTYTRGSSGNYKDPFGCR